MVKIGVTTRGEGTVETYNGRGQSLVHLTASSDGSGGVIVRPARD